MTRLMYDSTNPADIPTNVDVVGGYDDGIYGPDHLHFGQPHGWDAAGWARFPHAVQVHFSAVGNNVGVVGDVEPGCIWPPSKAVAWVLMRRAAGIDPSIYCNERNAWSSVRLAFQTARVPEPHYIVANYSRPPAIPAGAVGHQYANPTLTGHHYDLSVVVDNWPGIDTGGSDLDNAEHNLLVQVAVAVGANVPVDPNATLPAIAKDIAGLQPGQSPDVAALITKVDDLTVLVNRLIKRENTPPA